ncbi:hypothetical protein [Flavobacterium sp. 7A]|uniref:hypothetical protein n=1 Tax=Flavobacterium sp. 7A TaxID=2940571 RepID=UPI002227B29D|nr:hypothetical protein [Flavobacterium sp. 7A]MCW2118493.1 hypothetical protein [Flavobacterium sp. 7A]
MKILFLCGSVELGSDGVGDYTRRLCGALIQSGHDVMILSLCDLYIESYAKEFQNIEGIKVLTERIPLSAGLEERRNWTQNTIDSFQPDWISLQFVPYSFHPKGVPYWLPKFLHKLKGTHEWHIMFHELWIGLEKETTYKKKCVGLLQKEIIRKLAKKVNPKIVHTQAKVYQYYLSTINIRAQYLPLFGNVAVTAAIEKPINCMVFVVFATIHNGAPIEDFIVDLKNTISYEEQTTKFIFVGRNGDELKSWTASLEKNQIPYDILGSCSEEIISNVLCSSSYGISTTPFKISDKSGVVAAYRDHQLPIISIAKPWTDAENINVEFNDFIEYKGGAIDFLNLSNYKARNLDNIALEFSQSLIIK